jgi:AAA15 family ATPase/GTPase
VKGIKSLDQLVSLSFYKKTIPKEPVTQEYNIKGIYGMNGSGKSGIVTSVEILKNLLGDPGYLNNPIVQKNLDAMINKKTGELFIEIDYLVKGRASVYRYSVTVSMDDTGKHTISHEQLSAKNSTSKSENMETIFEVSDGELIFLLGKDQSKFVATVREKTMNLLATASMSALFLEKFFLPEWNLNEKRKDPLWTGMGFLWLLGERIHVYLDQSDNHREYVTRNTLESYKDREREVNSRLAAYMKAFNENLQIIEITENIVSKEKYGRFEETIDKLYEFLHIFKSNLQRIEIDRKEKYNYWVCDLVMAYDSYKIHAEYESTGIKKLIKLFAYLNDMVQGGIVFIDEFDSNLHDVYLCALLEYLMEYGEGQLCFTTHNVGPMDVLKQRKKSIDFLSEDHKIYPWTKSGNYSPSKLYRNGMIEGSPFNVDSIDFIGIFGSGEEDE